MDKEFWINAWEVGRTGFHQSQFNSKLLAYFPQFHPEKGQKVLVPLCGKTKDMIWLHDQGLHVRGIELHEEAVKSFFPENGLPSPVVTKDSDYKNFSHGNIVISCGDFFRFHEEKSYDFIYDRASLVALPPHMRPDYVKVLRRALKKDGSYLLLTYEYDEGELEGPPFSIGEEDIQKLYGENFEIRKIETTKPSQENGKVALMSSLKLTVYTLTLLPGR